MTLDYIRHVEDNNEILAYILNPYNLLEINKYCRTLDNTRKLEYVKFKSRSDVSNTTISIAVTSNPD
jgi:hypothetical protein